MVVPEFEARNWRIKPVARGTWFQRLVEYLEYFEDLAALW